MELTKVKKSIGHDRMTISKNFETGGTFKLSMGRASERLAVAFANDHVTARKQVGTIQLWLHSFKGTNLEKFDELERILSSSRSGEEVIEKMNDDLNKKTT